MNIINDFKTRRFQRHFFVTACSVLGAIAGTLEFIALFWKESPLRVQGAGAFWTCIGISLLASLKMTWPRPIEADYDSPSTKIRIVKGDLLDEDNHLVIGVCDTFDLEPPTIISSNSLLGQLIAKHFGNDWKRLDSLVGPKLRRYNSLGTIQKAGKNTQYEIGTTVAINGTGNNLVFLLAYCEMSKTNNASATVDGIWKSLNSLWAAVNMHGNQKPISITALGGGHSRLSSVLPAQDAIRLIALSYMFTSRTSKISDELRIVVRPEDYNKLDRMELQSFLSSLRRS